MSKDAIRLQIRERLARTRVTRFPDDERRVPNFRGAENAAALLRRLTIWRRARAIVFDTSAPQSVLRRSALAEGKTVYLAVGSLRADRCFLELDPQRLGARAWRAASLRQALRSGRLITPDQLPAIDLVVTGAIAVNRQGAMLGNGGGLFDLKYGLLRHLGKIREYTPVVTTVHSLQVIDDRIPMRAHDVPFDFAVTPDDVIAAPSLYSRPRGVLWDLLSQDGTRLVASLQRRRRDQPPRRTQG
jgi:5-formyltetrahydrofolate cyclo-ligase